MTYPSYSTGLLLLALCVLLQVFGQCKAAPIMCTDGQCNSVTEESNRPAFYTLALPISPTPSSLLTMTYNTHEARQTDILSNMCTNGQCNTVTEESDLSAFPATAQPLISHTLAGPSTMIYNVHAPRQTTSPSPGMCTNGQCNGS